MGKAYVKPCPKCGATDRYPPRPGKRIGQCRPCNLARSRSEGHKAHERNRYATETAFRAKKLRRAAEWKQRPEYQAYRQTESYRAVQIAYGRRSRCGLTREQQDALFCSQRGRCASCGDPIEQHARSTHLDHDHGTGRVRGFLCEWCNKACGNVKDSPQRARRLAAYLEKHAARRT